MELKAGVKEGGVALKIKEITGDKVLVSPLQSRVSAEIRGIDPLESREGLKQDIVNKLMIKDVSQVKIKLLRMATWGTQTAITVVPASYTTGKEEHMKIRTGLTIATIRVLPKVIRCYRCHGIGHISNKCTISAGKERSRKCGAMDHMISKLQ